ncbi:hypothetical protein [Arthrobacter sp. BF1]|uniref:hypothetical protein n=1 Tax=Arthrobacter sp. BF1 TaxID=2821145 RepID=UPI001C4FE44D|nr:hypothetical protein [Arthrobacter sp. BF1]
MATPPKFPGRGALLDDKSGTPRPVTPSFVTVAASLLGGAALMQVIATISALVYSVSAERRAALEEQIATMTGNAPSLNSLQNMGVLTVVMAGLVTVGAYVLFGVYLRKGRSWARLGAGVLVALTVIQLVGVSYPEGFTTLAQVILGALAVALCYLPEPSKFFAAVKASRS